jgi:hypothetical protein
MVGELFFDVSTDPSPHNLCLILYYLSRTHSRTMEPPIWAGTSSQIVGNTLHIQSLFPSVPIFCDLKITNL